MIEFDPISLCFRTGLVVLMGLLLIARPASAAGAFPQRAVIRHARSGALGNCVASIS